MFDKEEWKIVPADAPEKYAGAIDNSVSVYLNSGEGYDVLIVVPSDLFSYLPKHFLYSVEEMRLYPLRLFLDQISNTHGFVFGITGGRTGESVYLWQYPSLPTWARKR